MTNRFSLAYVNENGARTQTDEILDEQTSRRYNLRKNSDVRRFSALANSENGECFVFVGYTLNKDSLSEGRPRTTVTHVARVIGDDGTVARYNLRQNSDTRNFVAAVNEQLG